MNQILSGIWLLLKDVDVVLCLAGSNEMDWRLRNQIRLRKPVRCHFCLKFEREADKPALRKRKMTNNMKLWSGNFRLDNFTINIQLCNCRTYEEYKVHEKIKKLIDDFFATIETNYFTKQFKARTMGTLYSVERDIINFITKMHCVGPKNN